jgi:hypothetical protein
MDLANTAKHRLGLTGGVTERLNRLACASSLGLICCDSSEQEERSQFTTYSVLIESLAFLEARLPPSLLGTLLLSACDGLRNMAFAYHSKSMHKSHNRVRKWDMDSIGSPRFLSSCRR